MEKSMGQRLPKKAGRPPGTKNFTSRSAGSLTIRFDEPITADLEFLRVYYRQTEYASIIRMAIAELAHRARGKGSGVSAETAPHDRLP